MHLKTKLLATLLFVASFTSAYAEKKWDDLTDDQKIEKLKSFRAENQKYLKTTLGMTQTQLDDLDNVNICYLSTLDRINRYVKDEGKKDQYAEAVWNGRWAQVDAIMGQEKHQQYAEYLKEKIEKATKK